MKLGVTGRCLTLLEKCKNTKHLMQAHGNAITCGLGNDPFALSRLLDFCSRPFHGTLSHGWKIFRQIEHPTICILNTMIKSFLVKGDPSEAIEIYRDVLTSDMRPDNYTLPHVLKACSSLNNFRLGELIHGHCLKLGFLFDVFVGNTLTAMYSAFGDMEAARCVFDEVPRHCVVSITVLISGYAKIGEVDNARLVFDNATRKDRGIWGSMISGYVQNNCFKEGLKLFQLMQLTGIEPDEAILVSVLCACAHLGALDIGIWVHGYLDRLRLPLSVRLGTALVDMYAKCGCLELARVLFDKMPQRDTVSWNAMISGLATNGFGNQALKLFSDMEGAGFRPDDVTFIALFNACSYSGMAQEGLRLLDKMHNEYNIEPKVEHYGCIIDFLGRAGLFEEAKGFIQGIPPSTRACEEAIAWRALLSAACGQGLVLLAKVAAEKLVALERHSGVYVLLSNAYSAAGDHDDAGRTRKIMKRQGISKTPGSSSVVVDGAVHEFVAGEKTHNQIEEIHKFLDMIKGQLE